MPDKVIIDTCIWVDFFNNPGCENKRMLDLLIDGDRAVVIGPVLAEVMNSCDTKPEAERVAWLLSGLESCPVSEGAWRHAGLMGRELKSRGIVLPLSDLVVAAVALRQDYELFTVDTHFDVVSGLRRFSV